MTTRFAFAVNNNNEFEDRHFGDHDKFVIYEWDSKRFHLVETITNKLKDDDDDDDHHHHGDNKKGKGITKLLKEKGVKVLVSKQFGQNIRIIRQKFVPVITSSGNIEEVQNILPGKMQIIAENMKSQDNHNIIDLRKKD